MNFHLVIDCTRTPPESSQLESPVESWIVRKSNGQSIGVCNLFIESKRGGERERGIEKREAEMWEQTKEREEGREESKRTDFLFMFNNIIFNCNRLIFIFRPGDVSTCALLTALEKFSMLWTTIIMTF